MILANFATLNNMFFEFVAKSSQNLATLGFWKQRFGINLLRSSENLLHINI